MYNFYQSKPRVDIQKDVYKNPHFMMELFGTEYFGVVKEKKLPAWCGAGCPIVFRWYQILGVKLPNDEVIVKKELDRVKQKLQDKFGNVFLQLGIVNEIVRFENANHIAPEFKHDMRELRLQLRSALNDKYQLQSSFRENMPQAGIWYDVTRSHEELLASMNESCRKRVKKSISQGLEFRVVDENQYEIFFSKWQETAGKKGFNTITKVQYNNLLKYMTHGKGMLIGAFLGDEMIAGTVCLLDGEFVVCPYGFYDRNFNTMGVQHFLKFKLFERARGHGFVYVDTGGGAPTGFPEHELGGVTEFKESLGGEKIEYYGNYDLVLNKFLYRVFRLLYRFKR